MQLLKKIFKRCPHDNKRMIYGDEINQTIHIFRKPTIARVRCTDCGRALYKVGPTSTPDHQVSHAWE